MQDIEFTVQEGRLYILQTRSGKRTGAAAVRIAVEMASGSSVIDRDTALLRVEPVSLHELLVKTVDPQAKYTSIATGLPATPAAAVGKVVFDPEKAVEMALGRRRSSWCAPRRRPRTWPACTRPRGS